MNLNEFKKDIKKELALRTNHLEVEVIPKIKDFVSKTFGISY